MNWAVLTLRPGFELSAAMELQSLGVSAYCPIIKRLTKPRHKSSPVEMTSAAFPCYMFADENFIDFDSTPNLKRSNIYRLRLGGELCTVDEGEIERMRSEDDMRCFIPDTEIKFQPMDSVYILTGPLIGLRAMVLRVKNQHAQLDIAGFSSAIYMPTFSLKKLEATVKTLQ